MILPVKSRFNTTPNTPSFGTPLYNRSFTFTSGYKYGFNGKEKDNEVSGAGNAYDFEGYGYDPRLGRRKNLDSKASKYPKLSPYVYSQNNPILFVDPNGKDGVGYWETTDKGVKTLVIKADYHYIEGQFDKKALDAVHTEFSSVKTDGKGTNVRFEVNFIPEKQNTDLTKFNGENGQNYLTQGTITKKGEVENSNFKGVKIDIDKVKGPLVADDGNKYSFSKSNIQTRLINAISHGIGHNIGLTHDDSGVMEQMNNNLRIDKNMPDGFGGNAATNYSAETKPNNFTSDNAGTLKDRVDDMSVKGRDYWKGKTDKSGADVSGSGVIKITEAPQQKQ